MGQRITGTRALLGNVEQPKGDDTMTTNQDLIDEMDLDGARFTVRQNDPDAISEAVAGWFLERGVNLTNITVHDCGDITADSRRLSEDELVEFVRYSLANFN